MKTAISLRKESSYVSEHQPVIDAKKARKEARSVAKVQFQGLVFENLSSEQKDLLLKELAIRAGLLEDSIAK